tara:strand:- start:7818 stop:9146 length:1329 start_codon:yes stop_codon:yes gene_type:complete
VPQFTDLENGLGGGYEVLLGFARHDRIKPDSTVALQSIRRTGADFAFCLSMESASHYRRWRMSGRTLTIAHTESSLAWGGQEIRIMAEMTGLRERGHRMLLAAPTESLILQRAVEAGFEVLALQNSKWSLPGNAFRLADWLGRHQVDVVNPHSSRDGWAAGIGGRLAGVPLIIRSRHFDVPFGARLFSRAVYTRLADHLITTSPVVSANFRRAYALGGDRVSTIPTGVDLSAFQPDGPKADFAAPRGQGRWPLVGMVAVLRRAKGHVHMVKAARILHDQGMPIRLLFVGDGPSKAPIVDEISRCQLEKAVTFAGHRDDIPAVLRSLDCAAFPSLRECIPQGAMQAMACGVPVLGSDTGGIPSVIRDGRTGRIFPAGDSEALADSLASVFKQRQRTEKLRQQALRYVREQHGLPGMLDRLESLYARLLSDCNGAGLCETVPAA